MREREREDGKEEGAQLTVVVYFLNGLFCCVLLIRSQVQHREGSAHASVHPNALFAFASTTITTTKRRQADDGKGKVGCAPYG